MKKNKRTIKQQVIDGVEKAIQKIREEGGSDYLHFSELVFQTDDYVIRPGRIGIPWDGPVMYEIQVAWSYMRKNFDYIRGVEGYHKNSKLFKIN